MVDYLYLGPDKSGSTWLYALLNNNSGFEVAKCKDLYFFDRYYSRGFDWYEKHFTKNNTFKGEISHDYLYSLPASLRIKECNENVKLITFLRNPVERSYSHYLYLKRSGMTKKKFIDAINEFPEIIENSLYHLHLDKYRWAIENGNLGIFLFDDLKKSERKFAENVISFLTGNGNNIDINLPGKQREASEARSFIISKILKKGAVTARNIGLENIVGFVKHSKLSSILYKNYKVKPELSLEEKQFLNACFEDSICQLQEKYKLDVSSWINHES